MDSNFHEEERRPRTVIRARAAEEGRMTEEDWARMMEVVIVALQPFPEARMAVVAALKAAEEKGDGVRPGGC